ncbi:hypothetical protein CDD82_2561 [Ophiocordyceps australis]|uniref:Anaphase-promoting complex subunit 1 N-terminal domain-containing protein n=1 Tax=Ophiocordyceps australis TaxID=1399860 RepID=A0A2C5ZGM7_9HYPO|nr:hypothetical protein CDD82_2561 [Ophiocordyceps australis]
MASVKSLGLHKPSGLAHAIQEGILAADASPLSYTWNIVTDGIDADYVEDELLTTSDCVLWCRGRLFRKAFRFNLEKEPVIQALLAYFPASQDAKIDGKSSNGPATLEKALVVFLKTQVHIYFLTGTSHVVHMPFEVESACAGLVGVIIQRKAKAENEAPVCLKFPRVAPNSFVASELNSLNCSQQTTFSTEGLGNPQALHLSLRSTLDNMWDSPLEQPESHWPRLLSLTDPLSEIGLVVTEPDRRASQAGASGRAKSDFLDPMEEVLHIEKVQLHHVSRQRLEEPLVLAVTVNRERSTYSVWRLTYLAHKDPFTGYHKRVKKRQGQQRKSSVPPAFSSGVATPVPLGLRESFGAPLPGKRQRKSDKIDKPLDLVSSLEKQDSQEASGPRRSSRRISSMLARADLSASHERPGFGEQPLLPNSGVSRRLDSKGHHQGRSSSSFHHTIHPSLSSLLEAPVETSLDPAMHKMGLEDHDFDGLQHDVRFTKIQSIPFDNSNVRYSASAQPARDYTEVFILPSPLFAVDELNRLHLLIAIQDSLEKRLQLLTMHVTVQDKSSHETTVSVIAREQWKVHNVLDSSKLMHQEMSVILVLSEAMDGHHQLSIQAPWMELIRIDLPPLLVDDTGSIQFREPRVAHDMERKLPETIEVESGSVIGLRYPRQPGVIDVLDDKARLHQLRIQLKPTCPLVQRALDICKSVLPSSMNGKLHSGWIHAMLWLKDSSDPGASHEWSAFASLVLACFMSLDESGAKDSEPDAPQPKHRTMSGSMASLLESDNWKNMMMGDPMSTLGCPPWMMNRGWQWALDEQADIDSREESQTDTPMPTFLSRQIALAKGFLSSEAGEAALGVSGYMPIALSRSPEIRRKVAVDILMALHLLLEEEKLNIMTPEYLAPGRAELRVILCQITRWLKWPEFWSVYELGIQEDMNPVYDGEVELQTPIPQPPVRPDVLEWIQSRLVGERGKPFLTPADIYYASPNTEMAKMDERRWNKVTPRTLMFKRFFKLARPNATAVQMVEAMRDCGLTNAVLETLPEGLVVPLQDAIALCQARPPPSWGPDLLELVKRSDIDLILSPRKRLPLSVSTILTPSHASAWDYASLCRSVDEMNSAAPEDAEGTERQAVIRVLFKHDRRLNEAQNLLSTHKARVVRLDQDSTWPDSEYLERQKDLVARIATGTLAIPPGRALLYYSLRYPIITQKLHISGFNLNCVVKPNNVTVGVDKSMFTEDKVCWGFFHQGVAAGLAISRQAKGIDTSWILFNKPGQELSNRHAGFLLGLGLNGHLKDLAKWLAFKYLTPKHTMTSVGLLLGLSASYLGTADSLMTRLLSVHSTRMLPRGAADLNLSPLTQTAAILGIGLLYCGSQHRRMSEIMLSEIEHIDEEDQEEPLRNECYRLAAGFALGFINLAKGNDLRGLYDMRLTEKLISYATGTKKVEIVNILDRAAAGAVMAIALIFIKSDDELVARKIDVPQSLIQFDYVRPDMLLLRTVAKNLILWSRMEPTFDWIMHSLPPAYRPRYSLTSVSSLRAADLPFFCILAALCFSLALRFAGTASTTVRDLLLHYLDQYTRVVNLQPRTCREGFPLYDQELTRSTACTCRDLVAVSCSIVMAGTGDIPLLRRLRALHGRQDWDTPYGSHMAAHLAIGALFLGCGTATFASSNLAIAALLLAFYPMMPMGVGDNRSHLQAFRHFWVLAVEQRCLVAKDVLTGQPVSIQVRLTMIKDDGTRSPEPLYKTTPCLLPALDSIARLATVCGPKYWDLELDFSRPLVKKAFAESLSLHLRPRPPRDGLFTSSLLALSRDPKDRDALEDVFKLQSLSSTASYAERLALFESCERDAQSLHVLDCHLEMARAIADGADRERLENARLLFAWGAARRRLLAPSPRPSEHDAAAAAPSEPGRREAAQGGGGEWWMSDAAIDVLRGQVWLAARDGVAPWDGSRQRVLADHVVEEEKEEDARALEQRLERMGINLR